MRKSVSTVKHPGYFRASERKMSSTVDTLNHTQSEKDNLSSIYSMVASRWAARKLLTRIRPGKRQSEVKFLMPTYQLEPTVRFSSPKVTAILKEIIDARMRTFRYSPKSAQMLSRILTSECKDAVKKLQLTRYKYICHIVIGEKKSQSMSISSQSAWNEATDNVASYSWESSVCFCNVMMFGVYHD